jgi:hypothetical protein
MNLRISVKFVVSIMFSKMNVPTMLVVLGSTALIAGGQTLSLDRTTHFFGRISPKMKVSTEFELRNTGQAVLELRDVRANCGCTVTQLEKRALKPGESTTLNVQYDPIKDRGVVHRGVSVFSNDSKQDRTDLELVAEVVPSVALSDHTFFFSGLLRSDVIERTVKCTSTNSRELHLKSVDCGTTAYLRAEAVQRRDYIDIKVRLDASLLPANAANGQQVIVVRTDDADTPEVALEIYWATGNAVQADPIKLAFDPAPKGTVLRLPLTLRQCRGAPFRILECKAAPSYFKVEGIGGKPAKEHVLSVVLSADAPAGIHTGNLVFTVDDPNQRAITVELMAFLK